MASSWKDKAEMWLAQPAMFRSNVLQAMCGCIEVAYHFFSGEAILSL